MADPSNPIVVALQRLVLTGIKSTYVSDPEEHPDGGSVREIRFYEVEPNAQGGYDTEPVLVVRFRGTSEAALDLTLPRSTVNV